MAEAVSPGFTVQARTILELGAELISSDSIALYELIKNAYDAGSKRAVVSITSVFSHREFRNALGRIAVSRDLVERLVTSEAAEVERLSSEIEARLDLSAPERARQRFRDAVSEASTLDELEETLRKAYDDANVIEIVDTGHGMSLAELREVFLTIGTRSRLERSDQHYVGGKGIGRLSAMRLGDRLRVVTTRAGEERWNLLDIDWTLFSHAHSGRLEAVKITPRLGEQKFEASEKGTRIEVRGLKADWSWERLDRLAKSELDRLFDPFSEKARYPVVLSVNTRRVPIPTFDRALLSEAQAKAYANYYLDNDGSPHFVFQIEYLAYGRSKTIHWDETDIVGITSDEDVSLAAMRSLGPFTAHLHWFNRQRLRAIEGVGDRQKVRDLVNHWANGLLMYRDGFRVNPYGAPDDDWLGIDVKALGASGYKVNRKQLIGAVNITAAGNPYLVDQTNREGLRSNEERRLLILLLRKAVTDELRIFFNAVDREVRSTTRVNVKDTAAFLDSVGGRTKRTLKTIRALLPPDKEDDVAFLEATFTSLEERLKTARDALTTAEREQRDLVNLAGIGLLVEIVSHELGRVTRRTLDLIADLDRTDLPSGVVSTFETVESQMRVIRRRLDMLDPLSPSGRNRRETFDLSEMVEDVLASHEAQFQRNGITASFTVTGRSRGPVQIKAVKGMIVQVLENLTDNSVFWLAQKARMDPSFKPKIEIEIDPGEQVLTFTDNGPGIPAERAEDVFKPFVTTKPPGEGKGLGLYISKEIARYHGSDLYLMDAPKNGRLNTFIIDINGLL